MLATSYSKKIMLVCALTCATQGTRAENHITKKIVAIAAVGGFFAVLLAPFSEKSP